MNSPTFMESLWQHVLPLLVDRLAFAEAVCAARLLSTATRVELSCHELVALGAAFGLKRTYPMDELVRRMLVAKRCRACGRPNSPPAVLKGHRVFVCVGCRASCGLLGMRGRAYLRERNAELGRHWFAQRQLVDRRGPLDIATVSQRGRLLYWKHEVDALLASRVVQQTARAASAETA